MKITINKNKCQIKSFNLVPTEDGYELNMKVKDEDVLNKDTDFFNKVVIDYTDKDPEHKSEINSGKIVKDSGSGKAGNNSLSKYTINSNDNNSGLKNMDKPKEFKGSRKKIVVIEDDEMINKVIINKIKKFDVELHSARDGEEGIKLIMETIPDLIVTDLMMPYINGLEVVEHVRDKIKVKIPIIALSAIEDEDTILTAFKLGVDDYVTKPFGPDELLLRIKRLLSITDKAKNLRVSP